MQPNIRASCDEIFRNLIYSFDVWVFQSLGTTETDFKCQMTMSQTSKLQRLLWKIYRFFPQRKFRYEGIYKDQIEADRFIILQRHLLKSLF